VQLQDMFFFILAGVGASFVNNIPYHRQVTDYACGDGSSEMVLHHYGSDIDQRAIIDVLRTSSQEGTLSDDIVRGARFSQFSGAPTTAPFPFPKEAPQAGWNEKRHYGYGGFLHRDTSCWYSELKDIVESGYPIILLMHYSDPSQQDGHFRVAFGYDEEEQAFMLLDPWDRTNSDASAFPQRYSRPHPLRKHLPRGQHIRSRKPRQSKLHLSYGDGDLQPRVVYYSTEELCALWDYPEINGNFTNQPYFGAFIAPWQVSLTYVENVDRSMTIHANVSYLCPTPFFPTTENTSIATNSTILLTLPSNMKLMHNHASLLVELGDMKPTDTVSVSWVVSVEDSLTKSDERSTIAVQAYGLIQASVPDSWLNASTLYAAGYSYQDVIGGAASILF